MTEWLLVIALLTLGLFLNLGTYNDYPTVWADEVLWSEPAINLVKTGHFTTSVWQFQRAGSFWAAQSPLYCFALAGWLKLFGTDLLAARSFNYALVTVGSLLVWFAAWRCRLIARPALRVCLIPLLLLGYGLSFSYRCSRPDILGMLCLLCFGLAFFVRGRRRRLCFIFVSAALAPWIGLQVGLYVFIVCGLAWGFFEEVTLGDCCVVGSGLCVGIASMFLLFHLNGVLPDLLASISQAAHEKQHWGGVNSYWASVPRRLSHAFGAYLQDLSCGVLLAGVFGLALGRLRWLLRDRLRAVLFLGTVALVIPLVFSFAAHFAFYYAYMIYVPLTLMFLIVFERLPLAQLGNRWRSVLGVGVVVAACLAGLPLRLLLSHHYAQVTPRSGYAPVIQRVLVPDDVVFADYPAFFECKAVASRVYSPMYSRNFVNLSPHAQDFTDEEKRGVTVLAIPASMLEPMRSYWGGEWVAITPPMGDSMRTTNFSRMPFINRRLDSYFSNPQCVRRPIQLFRRTEFPP